MRYAVVIEKASANYAAYVPDCLAVLPLRLHWKKPSPTSEKRLSFILKASKPMAFPFHYQAAKSTTSTFRPKS